MILPSKTIQLADSLLVISATILEIIKTQSLTVDDLLEELNQIYYKTISIEKLILAIDFLYVTGKILDDNEVIKINIKQP